MSQLKQLRRLAGDVRAVVRTADLSSSARWLLGLIAHAPQIARSRSLIPADLAVSGQDVRFRSASGQLVQLPGEHFAGAREMYCRNVYLRTGIHIDDQSWAIDLGANSGLFTTYAAVLGARVVAVEAQAGFADEIQQLARRNRVSDRVNVMIAMIGPDRSDLVDVGLLTDPEIWSKASHADEQLPSRLSMNELLAKYGIDRVGVMKIDIEGGEFGLFSPDDDLEWLDRIDQITMEVHPAFGEVGALVYVLEGAGFETLILDNDGERVVALDPTVNYLYATRG